VRRPGFSKSLVGYQTKLLENIQWKVISHIEFMGPLPCLVNLEIIHDAMPDVQADQRSIKVEECGFVMNNTTSGLNKRVLRGDKK
jgi:hypothetical protein